MSKKTVSTFRTFHRQTPGKHLFILIFFMAGLGLGWPGPVASWAAQIVFFPPGPSQAAFQALVPATLSDPADGGHPETVNRLAALFGAYPDYCRGLEIITPREINIIMADGRCLLYDDRRNKDPAAKLDNPDLEDMLAMPYLPGPVLSDIPADHDPGRVRVTEFFNVVYGGSAREVQANCVPVRFCGQMVSFNQRNGAARSLAAVGEQLEGLLAAKPELRAYVYPLAGTFNWRYIEGTQRLGPHSWAVAIDLNPSRGLYWRWAAGLSGPALLKVRQNYPVEIVSIFEKHGFIWGGKWGHFDLMHFEYRPELIKRP